MHTAPSDQACGERVSHVPITKFRLCSTPNRPPEIPVQRLEVTCLLRGADRIPGAGPDCPALGSPSSLPPGPAAAQDYLVKEARRVQERPGLLVTQDCCLSQTIWL